MSATSRRRRVVGAVAAVVFVIGFAVLYLQSHNAKNRRDAARDSVKDNSLRYAVAVRKAVKAGPVSGRRLLELREVYRNGGGLVQGIEDIGATTTDDAGVIVTFSVRVNFKGSFGTAQNTSSCYKVTTHRKDHTSISRLPTIDCRKLLPDIAPTTTLALP